MKSRMLIGLAVLTLLALGLSAPAVSQTEWNIHWQIIMRGEMANTWAVAEYAVLRPSADPTPIPQHTFTKFSVEAVTPGLPDGTQLGVYLGPSIDPKEPYGKLVGVINISEGTGAMVRFGAKVPVVRIGTSVTVANLNPTPGQPPVVLKGKF